MGLKNSMVTSGRNIFAATIICMFIINDLSAQDATNNKAHTYRPGNNNPDTSASIWPSVYQQPDSLQKNIETTQDTTIFQNDSIRAREAFMRDSIAKRQAFVRDSLIKREAFVRDSIAKRKRIVDSLKFLQTRLPRYFEASLKTSLDDIIIGASPVKIIGDSILSDYTYNTLIFNLSKPYTPWQSTINLSTNPVKFKVDTIAQNIVYIKFKTFMHKYTYNPQKRILRIDGNSIVLSKSYGKLYNIPVDSVFYDSQGRITKIKRYHHYHQVVGNYQKGASMYMHLKQVKQYQYSAGSTIAKMEITNFCDRWRKIDPHKVCNIITYTIHKEGNNYALIRQHDPVNVYSDGKFIFEFGDNFTLKSVEFKNNKKTEDWKTVVEVNEEGNVSRYVYINKGKVNQTLLVNYNNDPEAKHKVETISCFFEDDKISYRQKNNTTGEIRVRDRLTMEWSPWK